MGIYCGRNKFSSHSSTFGGDQKVITESLAHLAYRLLCLWDCRSTDWREVTRKSELACAKWHRLEEEGLSAGSAFFPQPQSTRVESTSTLHCAGVL